MNQTIKGIIIGMVIALVLIGAYIGFNGYSNYKYQIGVNDGLKYFQSQIDTALKTNGYLNYYQVYQNKTYSIKLVPYGNWTEVK